MSKIEEKLSIYKWGDDWRLAAVTGEKTKFFLHNIKTGTSKMVGESTKSGEELDDEVSVLRRDFEELKNDIIFDEKINPKHLVEYVSRLWEDASGENDFHNNMAYMVLGAMIKAYHDMEDAGNPWLRKDEVIEVAIMKGVHKVGNMLEMVEHRIGGVNATANNVGNLN